MSEFEMWWHNEGSAGKANGVDWHDHVYEMCRIAWENGAYWEKFNKDVPRNPMTYERGECRLNEEDGDET